MRKLFWVISSVAVALILAAESSAHATAVYALVDAREQAGIAGSPKDAPASAASTVLAFPGAEGFGANSRGGRGGTIYEVTNTNDAGSGSLRSCVQASGPRICIFKTGGLISLNSPLTIRNPYITIAGQTAPGGGITIRLGTSTEAFSTQTHDVIMRYITVRPGPGGENHGNQIAANGVALYNIMIDHNTYSWGVDSDIETWYRVTAATIQWSLISEGLDCSTHSKGCHSKGLMIGGYAGSEAKNTIGSENISILHNLMAHNADRNPLMQMCGIAQVVNNVTYDPEFTFSHQQLNCPLGASYVNWIGNYHKKGPSSTSSTDLKVIPADSGTWYPGKLYVQGNIGPSRTDNSQPETKWVAIASGGSPSIIVTTPAPAPAVTTTDAPTAYRDVLADAGNSRGLNCDGTWFSRRDAIDNRIVNDVVKVTGGIIDDPSQVGGWIAPAPGNPCADSDHDGMPDAWESIHGFNPNDPSDGTTDLNGDGYTNVEDYLNGTTANTPPSSGNAWVGGISLAADRNVVAVGRPEIGTQVMAYNGFTAGNTTLYVPMLFANAFGGTYNAALYVQNIDAANTANITLDYYDSNGNLTCSHTDSIPALSSHGYWMPTECMPDGWVGGVVITADHNVVAVGRPHIGAEITTYNGFASGSTSMYVPMLFRNAFGGTYNAALYIQNTDPSNTANITIQYYDTSGNPTCSHGDSITPLASHGYWMPTECMSDGWVGGAVITADHNIVAVGRPHIGSQVTAYDGFSGGTTSAYVPMMYKRAGGTFNAALYVQDLDPVNSAAITLDFYDRTGTLTCTTSDTIPPLSSHGYWTPTISCLPDGWTGGVVISADHNVAALGRPHFGSEVFAYDGFVGGALGGYVPMLFASAFGGSYNSGFYLQNLDPSNTANLTIKYYDVNGNLTCTKTNSIAPLAAKDTWVPDVIPTCP